MRLQLERKNKVKTLKYLILLLPLIACHNDKGKTVAIKSDTIRTIVEASKKDTSFKPYAIAINYLVTDTGYYDAGIGDGAYAVIKLNNKLVDTIDLGYGMNRIDSSVYLYSIIVGLGPADKGIADPKYKKSINAAWGKYMIVENGKKEQLNKLTPGVDDYFSSPSIIANKIYYWQIKRLDSVGGISVSAAVFNPKTNKTISHYLQNDVLDTDDSGHFQLPYLKNDTIYFEALGKLMKFSKELKAYN